MTINILIIGGDGDLALRKLYPALYSLEAAQHLGNIGSITAMARTSHSPEDLQIKVREKLKNKYTLEDQVWNTFASKLGYHTGDATDANALLAYKKSLAAGPDDVLIVYLAVPPFVFGGIAKALGEAGLANERTRIIVEKPLGEDRDSFLTIDKELNVVFDEKQIYRIDHYLGKESIQNLFALRFANLFFSKLWRAEYIDSVQITVAETVGVEKRKEFYDATGALKDMVQNHLLQILCLVAMEPPSKNNADMVRAEKLKVLKSLKPISLESINANTVRGQYAKGSIDNDIVQSYQDDLQTDEKSDTETFVAIKAEIANWRWAGVPFYLRTGKRMTRRYSEIDIFFKPLAHNIFAKNGVADHQNHLQISLQPDSDIMLRFMNKKPVLGNDMVLQDVELNLSQSQDASNIAYDAYARLLLDAIREDQTLFISSKEVEASWEWIDGIVENWQTAGTPVHPYQSGSMGPNQAHSMLARDNREWD
ncbi:MAG: glucose-6-phosphate dehydrogenase [Gammaproteobacteria bacterium]|nr:glucose-6-phosphate dehydrogenase [Gammaproteobacteria bacterium]NNC97596.1 glucose-6-phosphate dehydrogenase [Gammaproteobacteria bacterium]NNM14787.1 glucose-6-phosphate dehydrogenase [Gammaproteobacteria bacterium]